jgi:hypothetical protein
LKTKLFASFIATLIFVSVAAASRAHADEWSPTKLILTVEGERPVTESVNLHSCLFIFQAPAVGLNVVAGYFGPSFVKKAEHWSLWVAPQVVGVTNYFPGREALGPSLQVSFNTEHTSAFADFDAYFGSDGRRAYYGLYTLAFKPVPWIELGTRADQTDMNFLVGPQAKTSQGLLSYGLAYLINPDTKAQEFRFIFGLVFGP